MIRIGPRSLLEDVPESVYVHGEPYILNQDEDGDIVLFEGICPHQRAVIDIVEEEQFRCSTHGWEFDPETGETRNASNNQLEKHRVKVKQDGLYVDIQSTDSEEFTLSEGSAKKPNISLISHACLLIEYDGFTLLTDPWIKGTALEDSWALYPPPEHDIDELNEKVDAIWVTHEHSDHLHVPTLEQFDSDIPVYVPELNKQRLFQCLSEAGFDNVHSLKTGEVYTIADSVEAVSFESGSTWNDSILLLNFDGFRILNVNDAGINWEVKQKVGTVDLVAAQSAPGASGYPFIWDHLTEDEKVETLKSRREGMLNMSERLVDEFDAEYFLPFAAFFELFQPEHREYGEKLHDIVDIPGDEAQHFEDHQVNVLDLLPGECWRGDDHEFRRRPDRETYVISESKDAYLDSFFESRDWITDREFDLTHEELSEYFESLSGSDLTLQVGDHALSMKLTGDERNMYSLVRFQSGTVRYNLTEELVDFSEIDSTYHVKMDVPGQLVQHVVRKDLSWDEIHNGYWGKFERDPDEYNLEFWRLLHAPWEARQNESKYAETYDIPTSIDDVTVADLIEEGEAIEEILMDYGLACTGCPAGIGENILEAAAVHGLDREQTERLVTQIEEDVGTTAVSSD